MQVEYPKIACSGGHGPGDKSPRTSRVKRIIENIKIKENIRKFGIRTTERMVFL